VRGAAITRRVSDLVHQFLAAFAASSEKTAYLLRAGLRLYMVERTSGFRWLHIGDQADLLEYLGEPQTRYRALEFDPLCLPDSPLPLLYRHHAKGRIEAFYRSHAGGIQLWVLDEHGALFEQRFDNALEHHFLTHQLRFFNSVLAERLLGTSHEARAALADRVHFYRIETTDDGRMHLQAVRPADEGLGNFLDLQVQLSRPGMELRDISVLAGSREFSSLVLGEEIYPEVARYLLSHRRRLEPYPFYITGIQPAELDGLASQPLTELLHIKRRVEQRLNAAQFAALETGRSGLVPNH
jgi:adenylate cyclase class 1